MEKYLRGDTVNAKSTKVRLDTLANYNPPMHTNPPTGTECISASKAQGNGGENMARVLSLFLIVVQQAHDNFMNIS